MATAAESLLVHSDRQVFCDQSQTFAIGYIGSDHATIRAYFPMSVGHGSGIIEKSWTDELIEFVMENYRFDHSFHIPLGGGSSRDGQVIYQDSRIPRTYFQRKGNKEVPAFKYLMLHEWQEKIDIDKGVPYAAAHAAATAIELAALQDDGFSVDEYDSFWSHWLPIVEKTKLGDGTPEDLDLHAYEEG